MDGGRPTDLPSGGAPSPDPPSGSAPRGGAARVALAFLAFFSVLSAYYLLRPVREEMAVRAGVGRVPWLFTATFGATLVLTPVFGWLASRFPRRRLTPAVILFFAAQLPLFFLAFRHPELARVAVPVFFVWLTVFSLSAVSASWSFMTDLFDREEARRRFGVVAAGASAGALSAPAAASVLAPRIGPEGLMLVGSGLLGVSAAAFFALARYVAGAREDSRAPIGGRILDGVRLALRSPFLRRIALLVLGYTVVSGLLYLAQTEIVGRAIPDSGRRTAFFARLDLSVNALALTLQLFLTGPLIRRLGAGGALGLVAGLVTVGIAVFALSPGLAAVAALQVAHRAGHFAFWRPARELLFVSLDAGTRYKAKNFVDTAVFRGGDVLTAWAFTGLFALGAGFAAAAWVTVPVAALWTALSLGLGRAWDRRGGTESPSPDPRGISTFS